MKSQQAAIDELARRFEEQVPDLAAEIAERCRVEIPEFAERPASIWEEVRRICEQSRRGHVDYVRGVIELPETCPHPDVLAAVGTAASGASMAAMTATYRIGHSSAWRRWLAVARDAGADVAGSEVIATVSARALEYDERVEQLAVAEFSRERAKLRADASADRARVMVDLLSGSVVDAVGLNYDLSLDHVAAVATGDRAFETLEAGRELIGADGVAAAIEDNLAWAWYGSAAGIDARTLGALEPPAGTLVAIGNPARGLDGFRSSHRQAEYASLVGACTGEPLTWFGDVSVEALLLRDRTEAEALVARELGPLVAEGARAGRLRETLREYFRNSGNAAATATALGVNEHTVRRRIAAAEEALGGELGRRHAELDLAIRLRTLLRAEPERG